MKVAIIFYGMSETRFRNFCANFVIVSILLLVFGVSFVAAYPIEAKTEQVNNAVYNGNSDTGSVALMFNVYERTDNVLKIAEILDEYGFKSTFFVGGCWAAKNGDTLLKLSSRHRKVDRFIPLRPPRLYELKVVCAAERKYVKRNVRRLQKPWLYGDNVDARHD